MQGRTTYRNDGNNKRRTEARAGIGTRKEQVQHDRGLDAGTRTTTDAVGIPDRGEGVEA